MSGLQWCTVVSGVVSGEWSTVVYCGEWCTVVSGEWSTVVW